MPIMVHHSSSHGNGLVPTWVRGMGASDIANAMHGTDIRYGMYNDQTQIGQAIISAVPEPTSLLMLCLGMIALCTLRRSSTR
jgi:hypothetical protein